MVALEYSNNCNMQGIKEEEETGRHNIVIYNKGESIRGK